MEKVTTIEREPTAWEETEHTAWNVTGLDGWGIRYKDEARAIKAEEFYKHLNWKEEILNSNFANDLTVCLVTAYFLYPLSEVVATRYTRLLPIDIEVKDENRVGFQKILLIYYSVDVDGYNERMTEHSFLDNNDIEEIVSKLTQAQDEKASV